MTALKIEALLPPTEGKWGRVWRGRTNRTLLGWLEVFGNGSGRWFSIPDASRYISVEDLCQEEQPQ